MDDNDPQFTTEPAYNLGIRYTGMGMAAACVPITYNGEESIFTTAGFVNNLAELMPDVVPIPVEDTVPRTDSVIIAFAAINQARKQAVAAGAELLS